ncbi:MAG TPA: M28 family peptidase [Gemmataceae bacterium]|jgi:Zn-dependent M28 family amino/carboxypeptidase|nr:M28 family peptidase [Gemmataceae bacterium]
MALRRMLLLLCLLALPAQSLQAANEAALARMRKDIDFLASDECEGRGVTTRGINLAADYVAGEFKKAGLKPAGMDGGYFQPFSITTGTRLTSPNTLVLHGPAGQTIALKRGVDFQVVGLSASGKVNAPLVFAGYGATASKSAYDDFHDLDARGKLLIVLRRTPRYGNAKFPFDGPMESHHAALNTKIINAEAHDAAGILFINDQAMAVKEDKLMDFGYTAFESNTKLPAAHLHRSTADSILSAALGKSLADLEADIDRDLKPHSAVLPGWTAALEVNVERIRVPAKNVIGVLDGAGPLANETVVIGAHYDHLGYGGFGSLARNAGRAIHHGADDNGSGTTALMELARRLAQSSQGRRLVFIAFSGEERGLLGSAYYCKNPVFSLKDTVAMVNMDMVGRLRPDKEDPSKDKLIVYGTGSAKSFDSLIDAVNARYGFKLKKIKTGMGPSDQQSFYEKHIPVFFFFTDDHPDYHRPTDTADKINVPGMARITDMVEDLIEKLATVPERPQYVAVAGGSTYAGMQGPTLGIRPAYDDDKPGILLNGVSPGGSAAKAGLREGDRITEIAGKQVVNLGAYMSIMAGQKKGETLDVAIVRDGKKMTIKILLQ